MLHRSDFTPLNRQPSAHFFGKSLCLYFTSTRAPALNYLPPLQDFYCRVNGLDPSSLVPTGKKAHMVEVIVVCTDDAATRSATSRHKAFDHTPFLFLDERDSFTAAALLADPSYGGVSDGAEEAGGGDAAAPSLVVVN